MINVVTAVSPAHEARMAALLVGAPEVDLVRRCADLPEALALVDAGQVDVLVLDAALPGLDASHVADLLSRCGVLGVAEAGPDDERLGAWGVQHRVSAFASADDVHAAVQEAGRSAPDDADGDRPQGTSDHAADGDDRSTPRADRGRVVTVWGTGGAPGRTVVASNLAVCLARRSSVLLVDADTCNASLAQHLGVLDEAPGVAAAARLAEGGRLDEISLAGVAPLVGERLRVLTGLPRPQRWPEVRAAALRTVLDLARSAHDWTIVDVAAPLEADEELSYDTTAPQRNMAARTCVEEADEILLVAAADPVGLTRLVRAVEELADVTDVVPKVVVTKVRGAAVGRDPGSQVREALERFVGVDPVLVPDDREAFDAALSAGRTAAEVSPDSSAVEAISRLASTLSGDSSDAGHISKRKFGGFFRRSA